MVTGQVGALLLELGRLEEARAALGDGAGRLLRDGPPLPRGRHAHQPRADRDGAGPARRRPRRWATAPWSSPRRSTTPRASSPRCTASATRTASPATPRAARESLERALADGRTHDLGYFVVHTLASLAALDSARDGRRRPSARRRGRGRSSHGRLPAGHRARRAAGRHDARAAGDPRPPSGCAPPPGSSPGSAGAPTAVEALAVLARALQDAGDAAGAAEAADAVLAELDDGVPPGIVLQGAGARRPAPRAGARPATRGRTTWPAGRRTGCRSRPPGSTTRTCAPATSTTPVAAELARVAPARGACAERSAGLRRPGTSASPGPMK